MKILVEFDENSEEGRYFLACARIRDVCAGGLLQRLFNVVVEDQLIASVLDDDSKVIQDRKRYEHRYADPPGFIND